VLNTALLNFVTASRLLFGMSREGLLPAWLGRLHPARLTPYRTFLVILPVAIVLALSGSLQFLAGTTATLILVMFCLVNVSLLIIKRRQPLNPAGLRIPALIPVLALVSNLILITFASQSSHLLSLVFVAVGLVLIGMQKALQGRSL
jgi:basic amino acid/polyamine antiporter, APA family